METFVFITLACVISSYLTYLFNATSINIILISTESKNAIDFLRLKAYSSNGSVIFQ